MRISKMLLPALFALALMALAVPAMAATPDADLNATSTATIEFEGGKIAFTDPRESRHMDLQFGIWPIPTVDNYQTLGIAAIDRSSTENGGTKQLAADFIYELAIMDARSEATNWTLTGKMDSFTDGAVDGSKFNATITFAGTTADREAHGRGEGATYNKINGVALLTDTNTQTFATLQDAAGATLPLGAYYPTWTPEQITMAIYPSSGVDGDYTFYGYEHILLGETYTSTIEWELSVTPTDVPEG